MIVELGRPYSAYIMLDSREPFAGHFTISE